MSSIAVLEPLSSQDPIFAGDVKLIRATRAGHIQNAGRPHIDDAGRIAFEPGNRHCLMIGGSRKGKSVLYELALRALATAGAEGLSLVDPHNSVTAPFIEWLAHPNSRQFQRRVRIIDPASPYALGFNILECDGTPEGASDAANALASAIESQFEASPEQTPRLARLSFIAGYACALRGLTLREVLEMLSLGGKTLRSTLLQDVKSHLVRRELEDLITLAAKSPREFLALCESLHNRLVRWLADPRLARILCQRRGLNLRRAMDERDIILLALGSLDYANAALIGTLYTTYVFTVARKRPELQAAPHRLFIDEAESIINVSCARIVDQCAKWGVYLFAGIQRLGQLRLRDPFTADAILSNSPVWLILGGQEYKSAEYLANNVFAGALPLNIYKAGTERATVVGQAKVALKSRALQKSESESVAAGKSYTRSSASGASGGSASLSSSAENSAAADSLSFVSLTPDQILGSSPAISKTAASSSARGTSRSEGHVHNTSWSRQSTRGYSSSQVYGKTTGTAVSEGESEALASVFQSLPTELYSLEDMRFLATAKLMNLQRREVLMRFEGQQPILARTIDREPAFRDAEYRDLMVTRYRELTAKRDPDTRPAAEVDHELATRFDAIASDTRESETNFAAPEEPSILDALQRAQRGFGGSRPPSPTDEPPPRAAPKLRVFDGGKDGDNRR